jgi:hypothetical protein
MGSSSALLFGIDGMAYLHPPQRHFGPLVAHELFHSYHAIGDATLLHQLWGEGLATYASARIVPSTTKADVLLSEPLAELPAERLRPLATYVLARLSSEDQADREVLFSSGPRRLEIGPFGFPPRSGYLLGYEVASHLGRRLRLQQLAALEGEALERAVRGTLATMAQG